jgi:hypothetical protein
VQRSVLDVQEKNQQVMNQQGMKAMIHVAVDTVTKPYFSIFEVNLAS